jgi:hypothetical protein
MNNERLTAGMILSRSIALLRSRPRNALTAFLVLTAIGVVSDNSGDWGPFLTLLFAMASLCFIFQVTETLLGDLHLQPSGYPRTRLLALFGLLFLSNLSILVGFVFLIVPGIYLLARLFVVVPILLAEDAGVGEAMRRSWDQTSGLVLALIAVFAAIYLPVIPVMFLVVGLTETEHLPLLSSLLLNLAINASMILGWYAAVAVYASGRKGEELVEVFA